MNVLEVKNLSVTLDGKEILRNVSFALRQGEELAIVGPNGAGKTVLFRALMGSIPYTGEIRWHEDGSIGYVPQRFPLDKNVPLTVKEFFELKAPRFWFPSDAFLSRIGEELAIAGLNRTILTRQLADLSGGEIQRVLIAWALVGQPSVLLFDEPTTGVDSVAESAIYEIIELLRQERHVSVILISHDLHVVSRYADRVLSLNREIVGDALPGEALTPERVARLFEAR